MAPRLAIGVPDHKPWVAGAGELPSFVVMREIRPRGTRGSDPCPFSHVEA
ncbi:MAG: hypothetical protein ABI667_09430 [Sphingomicrobium sp.]